MTFPYHYRLYGLTLRSTDPLLYLHPLPPSESPDVEISFRRQNLAPLNLGAESERRFEQTIPGYAHLEGWRTPDGSLIAYTAGSDSARILIDSCGAVHVTLSPSLALADLLPLVYGTALSVSMSIKGITCLHASAVALDDQAVLCVGSSGIGKSTLAAALVERGLQFVTDDVAALVETPDFSVQPGCDAVRRWSNAPGTDAARKLWQPLAAPEMPVPIRLIYLLGATSAQPEIRAVSKRDAFLTLAQHPYAAALQPAENLTRSLDRLRQLIDQVPVRRLLRSHQPDNLPDAVTLIERDLRASLRARL